VTKNLSRTSSTLDLVANLLPRLKTNKDGGVMVTEVKEKNGMPLKKLLDFLRAKMTFMREPDNLGLEA